MFKKLKALCIRWHWQNFRAEARVGWDQASGTWRVYQRMRVGIRRLWVLRAEFPKDQYQTACSYATRFAEGRRAQKHVRFF